ncbi:MAG TPA: 50S ribosomal protein L11 methyltransferase [Thermoplasmata archaeon]|nr:50S ribosomal protein L11 methyltransferase [Thermoplasmata archaeon]
MTRPSGLEHRVRRPPPAERVRRRLAAVAGDRVAREMPSGYHRLGRVLVIQRPEALAPYDSLLGTAWQEELGVETVLVKFGPIEGELRIPRVRCVAGGRTETEVVEHGVRWRFDAARIMFAAGNRTERIRAGRLVRPGEAVVDLFAGIGYFAIPAALLGRAGSVWAVEKNPLSVRYLRENAVLNGVEERVRVVPGDNRTVSLPEGAFDRAFLGYLPSAVPWVPRAVALLRPTGGWLHVHTVAEVRAPLSEAAAAVERSAEAAGARPLEPSRVRVVKPYSPGRNHVVVDARLVQR